MPQVRTPASSYTLYYPHSTPVEERCWKEDYLQVFSVDPARKNYALRIERRYRNGKISPIVFEKVSLDTTPGEYCDMYSSLSRFLDRHLSDISGCHYLIVERQLPQNYLATRIAQHTLSYLEIHCRDSPLLPTIVELDPKVKGQMLGYKRGDDLKAWSVERARSLLEMRLDSHSLSVLDYYRKKQDDLADTVCQIEALFKLWNLPLTSQRRQEIIILRKEGNGQTEDRQTGRSPIQ